MTDVCIISLGCSKNLVDSEIMSGILQENGFYLTSDEESADVIIVNTCAFIDDAKTEAINTILDVARYKKCGRLKKLIVTGCLAERYKDEVLSELPEVDAIVGISRFDEIANIIKSAENKFLGNNNAEYPESAPRITATPFYTSYIKIAEGCDNRCTYCAIPIIRGKYRSRKMEDILCEARRLAENGTKELIVIAQDTTRYGEDIYGKSKLPELLSGLAEIKDFAWIRVLYMYPERITDEILGVFAENDNIVNYFDIPIQHISAKVLKRMGRPCGSGEIRSLISKIRKKLPGCVIRTTLMTGFPGEDEGDFKELCDFVENTKFDKLGVFAYSREEGTPADKLDGHISEDIKQARRTKIMEIQKEISAENLKKYIGKTLPVLAEIKADDIFIGRTAFDAPEIDSNVYFTAEGEGILGEIVDVLITDADEYDLKGELRHELTE